jgi:hypothetical protein
MSPETLDQQVLARLGAPWPPAEVQFVPGSTKDGRALALAYIDARQVMSRLDQVVGPGNWSFAFDPLTPDGRLVRGKLTICGVTKEDAGQGDDLKGAVSDALKRSAVHFGVGRYLYHLPQNWFPLNGKRWAQQPTVSPAAVARALALCGFEAVAGAGQERTPVSVELRPDWTPEVTPAAVPESSGDRAVSQQSAETLICTGDGCGKPINGTQRTVSERNFGRALCPACQRTHARSAPATIHAADGGAVSLSQSGAGQAPEGGD